jgi:hypothetical protein
MPQLLGGLSADRAYPRGSPDLAPVCLRQRHCFDCTRKSPGTGADPGADQRLQTNVDCKVRRCFYAETTGRRQSTCCGATAIFNIEPPVSPFAIMRRAYPYRGENSGPARMIVGDLTPRPGLREQNLPIGDVARREALLSPLEHAHGETIGVNLTIHVGPKAIHLIALDTFDGHQWSSGAQPNKITTPERRSGLVLRV